MPTEGFEGFYVETRNYGATAAFWASLGFEKISETGHGSGGWRHPSGGPYVFIVEQHDKELNTWPSSMSLTRTASRRAGRSSTCSRSHPSIGMSSKRLCATPTAGP